MFAAAPIAPAASVAALFAEGGGPIYTKTAFVDSGASGGSLNNPNDPYPTVLAALTALGIYSGQAVSVLFKNTTHTENADSSGVTALLGGFSQVTFKTFTSATLWAFTSIISIPDSGIDGDPPTDGTANYINLVFDGVSSAGFVALGGGNGGASTGIGGTGANGGSTAAASVTLLNNSVLAQVYVQGGPGGAGGAGDIVTPGGTGGNGGNGGTINHDLTSSATLYGVVGGAGGAGGADNGAGAGTDGAAGTNGTYNLI